MRARMNGITLIEAMVVLVVVAVLATIALPSLVGARAASQSGAAKATLGATVVDAVRHSIATQTEVVVCSGQDQCSGSTRWDDGWLAFSDLDGDRRRDPAESLLLQQSALDEDVRLLSTAGRTRLVFQDNGRNAGSNVTFTLCDSRGARHATTLVLSNQGKLRQGKPTQAAALNCVHSGT